MLQNEFKTIPLLISLLVISQYTLFIYPLSLFFTSSSSSTFSNFSSTPFFCAEAIPLSFPSFFTSPRIFAELPSTAANKSVIINNNNNKTISHEKSIPLSGRQWRKFVWRQIKKDLSTIWSTFWYEDQQPIRLPTWRQCKTKNNATLPISMEFLFSEYPIPLNRTVWVTPRITRFDIGAQNARTMNASTAQKFVSSSSRTSASSQEATILPYGTRLEGTFRFRVLDKLWPVLAAKRVAWNFTQELAETFPTMSWPWSITKIEAALLDWSKLPPQTFYEAMSTFRSTLSQKSSSSPSSSSLKTASNDSLSSNETTTDSNQTESENLITKAVQKSWPIDMKALFGDQIPTGYSASKKANVTIEILSDEPDALFMCMEAFLRFQ